VRGSNTSQTTTNNNYIGSINITNINVSGGQPTGDSNFVTIPLPDVGAPSTSTVPLLNDSVVPPYPTLESKGIVTSGNNSDDNVLLFRPNENLDNVEYRKNKIIITDSLGNTRVYKYYPLNRRVIKLSHVNLAEYIRDAYYNRAGFTKIIDEVTKAIIYKFKHYISITFPDVNNGAPVDGAISRYYNKDDYMIYTNSKNKQYIAKVNNFLDNNYDFRINQGWRHVRGTIADKFTTYNENSFLYSHKNRTAEFLTDSKNIITLYLPIENNPKVNFNKFLWIMYRQPLNILILGDAIKLILSHF
jgi:hypothetical protein